MYQQGGTIEDALDRISKREYVLPAIQREFVWSPDQICRLFDSLMQGYPFGEFLFWQIDPEHSGEYRYYDFVLDYHQRDNPHCPDLGVLSNRRLTAVLDGQQRLTAFNIGLRGSMSIKLPRLWWSNPNAFPRRVLALDLLTKSERDEEGNSYRFEFVDENRIGRDGSCLWFQVSAILKMDSGPTMNEWLLAWDLNRDEQILAFRTLDRLHRVVRTEPTVAYYEEKNQNIEHVLNIFIRRNSGGTVLAYSDLLLSIAVSQWENRDARREVHALVDELNSIGPGLGLSKDFVLKAGLMLADVASVGFQVRNFTHENMVLLENSWDSVKAALQRTVQLVTSFGFDSNSIRANSALLPIAYYLHKINAPSSFDSSQQHSEDKEIIRKWITHSILKSPGIWGSGLDTLLTAMRDVIRNASGDGFPIEDLGAAMARRGRSLLFTDEEFDDLADMDITDKRVFAMLSLLFPFINVRDHHFHIDHVFPKSLFTSPRLRRAGVSEEQIDGFIECVNRIGNLQLMNGVVNIDKRAKLPATWMQEHFLNDDTERTNFLSQYLLEGLPESLQGFLDFYDTRRSALRGRIKELLSPDNSAEAT